MPAPEPTGLYLTVYPNASPTAGVQVETSGETNVLPAPAIVVSLLVAVAAVAATSAAASTASVIVSRLVISPACRGSVATWADALLPPGDEVVTARGRAS